MALPDADPGKIPDSVCDAFNDACFWAEHELSAAGELDGAEINRAAIRAGLAAALRFAGPAGPGGGIPGFAGVDERAVDAFWRAACYATDQPNSSRCNEVPRRAVRAGLAAAVRSGLAVEFFSQSSVTMFVDNTPKEP